MENEKDINLDDGAQELYETLGGIETSEKVSDSVLTTSDILEALGEEEIERDKWRIHLVDTVHHLSGYLNHVNAAASSGSQDASFNSFIETLTKLSRMPHSDGKILIRYRGNKGDEKGDGSDEFDYEILAGNISVEISVARDITRRGGSITDRLTPNLLKAFKVFASLDISTLHITIGALEPKDVQMIRLSLQVLVKYFMAVKNDNTSPAKNNVPGAPIKVVYNENKQPDPNLTLLAGINKVKHDNIQAIVKKVDGLMQNPTSGSRIEQCVSVYDAIFIFKNLREQLLKPPLEVNNVLWLLADKSQGGISREKARLSRTLMEWFGKSSQKAGRIIDGLYSNDFRECSVESLGKRLLSASDFLIAIDQNRTNRKVDDIEKEALQNAWNGLDKVLDDVLDSFTIEGDEIKIKTKKGGRVTYKLHKKILNMVLFFKRRAVTKKKIKEMLHHPVDFNSQDYETIAKDFDISVDNSKHLIQILKDCFTQDGRFNGAAFKKSIPELVKHEAKSFEFLWHYLKEIRFRKDRVVFLNSLQLLMPQMKQPRKIFKALLDDFSCTPRTLTFSDRNALVLANIFLRKYNKEVNNNLEKTPEEVLLVKEGLNKEMIQSGLDFVNQEPERFFTKTRTIHTKLCEFVNAEETDKDVMPFRYLLASEREAYIFLSLIGGDVAHKIIQCSVKEYGNPDSEIYSWKKSKDHMKDLLLLCQLTIRALKRFADKQDVSLLKGIKSKENIFLTDAKFSAQNQIVKKMLQWVDISIKDITKQKVFP